MQKKVLLLFINAAILFSMLAVHETKAPPSTIVGTTPLPSTAGVGTMFNISVTITNVVNLHAWELNMTFNTTVLDVVAVYEGPFLTDTGYGTWPLDPTIDNTRGIVTAGASFFPYPEYGADGNGTLAYITFLVQAKGKSTLHFYETKLRLWDWDLGELVVIPHTAKDGFFQLPLGDIDSDGTVTAIDLNSLGRAYGSALGQPSWNADADLNKDDLVNHDDLIIVSDNYGKT